MKRLVVSVLAVLLGFCASSGSLPAQVVIIDTDVIVPPVPPHPPLPPPRPRVSYKVESVRYEIRVRDQTARFRLSQTFRNTGDRPLEVRFLFPVPPDAVVSELVLLVDGKEIAGKLLRKEEARRIFESIVRRRRDPALLEYVGYGLLQTSVFPIRPGERRKVEVQFTQLLQRHDGLVDLRVPIRAVGPGRRAIERVDVVARLQTTERLKTVYSPTHKVKVERSDAHHAVCRLTLRDVTGPEDLHLLFGAHDAAVGMDLLSFRPERDEGGFFLLLAAPEFQRDSGLKSVPKTVVFVLDRSGSMSGRKIEQARRALRFMLEQLKPADTFNIVVYDSSVEAFRPELQRADKKTLRAARDFVEGIDAGGSTNIDAALQTALRMLTDSSRPSYVLFLTDGLPTTGERNELRIAENAKRANRVRARLFCFGVGYDVNSRLLDRLASTNRGRSVYVRPNEDIEESIARVARALADPVLTDLQLKFEFEKGGDESAPPAVYRVYPRELPDLFRGEQLVVVGRYRRAGKATVVLTGRQGDKKVRFEERVRFVRHSDDDTNSFVASLWAARRIGEILDELDLHGKNQELIDELVDLSLRFGIMTPYTSFLANEDTRLADSRRLSETARRLVKHGFSLQTGQAAFAQREFKQALKSAEQLSRGAPAGAGVGGLPFGMSPGAPRSGWFGGAVGSKELAAEEELEWTAHERVRRVGSKTFYWKQGLWRDATVTDDQAKNAVVVAQFSDEFFNLAARNGGRHAKYLTFDEPVLVNLGGRTYKIVPAKDSEPTKAEPPQSERQHSRPKN